MMEMLGLVLTPLYVFESGYPQPAAGLMALLVLVIVLSGNDRVPWYADVYAFGCAFIGYTAVVNWSWWAHRPDLAFLLSSTYYLYNFMVFAVVLFLSRELGDEFVPATKLGLILALVVELLALTFLSDAGDPRRVGTFNNPNQLGYWALLLGCCHLVLKGDRRLTVTDVAALAAMGYVVAFSASRAAIVAFALLVVLGALCQGLRARAALGVALAGVACAALALPTMVGGPAGIAPRGGGPLAEGIQELRTTGARASDSLAGRGYDRIWTHPEHLLLGAGEGAHERFATRVLDKELHSTLGTVLFSYGLAGLVLFGGALAGIFRRAAARCWLYALPVLLYGLTHQGLRFSLFWVFLALVLTAGRWCPARVPAAAAGRPAPAPVWPVARAGPRR